MDFSYEDFLLIVENELEIDINCDLPDTISHFIKYDSEADISEEVDTEFKIFPDLHTILDRFVGMLSFKQLVMVEKLVNAVEYVEEEKFDKTVVFTGKMVHLDELYDFLKNKDLYDDSTEDSYER